MHQVENSIIERLHSAPDNLELDGTFKRWGDSYSNWFVGHEYHKEGKTYCFASYGNWRTGEYYKYPENDSCLPTQIKEEFKNILKQQEMAHVSFQKEKAEKQKEIFYSLPEMNETHIYLKKKKIKHNYKARIDANNNLVVPIYDFSDFWGVQRINADGQKFFSTGVKLKSSFCVLKKGSLTPAYNDKIYFCEGYATACSIFEATAKPTVICFNAGNIDKVVKRFANQYGDASFIICADNDSFTEIAGKPFNVGIVKAQEACKNIEKVTMVYPKFKDVSTKPTDFNDLHVLEGIDEVSKQVSNFNPFQEDIDNGFTSLIYDNKKILKKVIRKNIVLKNYFDYKYKYVFYKNTKNAHIYQNNFYKEYDRIFVNEFAQSHFKPHPEKRNEIEEFFGVVSRHNCVDKDFFDIPSGLVNLKNGIFDINTMELKKHDSRFGFTYCLDYEYDPTATECPIWDKWLNTITQGNEQQKQAIQEYMVYIIAKVSCSDVSNIMIFSGSGLNGKSITVEIIKAFVGEMNCSSASIENLETNSFTTATITDKLLNIAEEENPKCFTKTDMLKKMTTGNPIQAQFKNKPIFEFINSAKIIMTYNKLPDLKDDTFGFKRRLVIIPFKHRFTDADYIPNVKEEIKKEYSAIFNRVCGLYKGILKRRSILIPEGSNEEYNEMLVSSDAFYVWFVENVSIVEDESVRVSFSDLYENYCENVEYPINKFKFARKINGYLAEFGIVSKLFRDGENVFKGYKKLKIKEIDFSKEEF